MNEPPQDEPRVVNLFEGLNDPVEILKIVHDPPGGDASVDYLAPAKPIDQIYTELTGEQAAALAAYACALIGSEQEEDAQDIIVCLSAYTEVCLEEALLGLIGCGSLWESSAFRRATPAVRDELLAQVEVDADNRRDIVMALAWIGDSVVVERFGEWRSEPPKWRKDVYGRPVDCSREAGWELDQEGQRRELFIESCVALEQGTSEENGSFQVASPIDEECPCCGSRLTALLDFAPAACGLVDTPALPERLQIITCEACSDSPGSIYGRLDELGAGHWHTKNADIEAPDAGSELPTPLTVNSLVLGAQRSAFHATSESHPTSFSQLGGHPTWVHDNAYPRCPDCDETMLFIAQVQRSEIQDDADGFFYGFLCAGCRTTATVQHCGTLS